RAAAWPGTGRGVPRAQLGEPRGGLNRPDDKPSVGLLGKCRQVGVRYRVAAEALEVHPETLDLAGRDHRPDPLWGRRRARGVTTGKTRTDFNRWVRNRLLVPL